MHHASYRKPHHQRSVVIGIALTLLTTIQLPLAADILPKKAAPNLQFELFRSYRQGGSGLEMKGRPYDIDAWVAKYQFDSNGISKVLWRKQLGNSLAHWSNGIATDRSKNIFISGYINSPLGEYHNAFVAKYSADGTLLWNKQLGTAGYDVSNGVATDSNGNVFISGWTDGALEGNNQGSYDAWVAKYSAEGTLLWKKQLGTVTFDASYGVATDRSGNVLISGATGAALGGSDKGKGDAWVAKYSTEGKLRWIKQLGTSAGDGSNGVATDRSGNVLITGYTEGALGGSNKGLYDAWIAKYKFDGTLLWKKQLGTATFDVSSSVTTDSSGNVFISGYTEGALEGNNKGSRDAFVAKYSPGGLLRWIKQLGTPAFDHTLAVTTDRSSNVFIAGTTTGALAGSNRGYFDAWVAKYNTHGKPLGLRQDGTKQFDDSTGVAIDDSSDVLVTGATYGNYWAD